MRSLPLKVPNIPLQDEILALSCRIWTFTIQCNLTGGLFPNTCHQVSPQTSFFFPLQKHMFSSFLQQHLLNTYYVPSPILGTSLFTLLGIPFPPSTPKPGIYSSFKIQPNYLLIHEKFCETFSHFLL